MEKFFVFLLILILTTPVTGLACDCCPVAEQAPAQPQMVRTSHDCCLMINVSREKCGIERTDELSLPVSSETSVSPVASSAEIVSLLNFQHSSSNEERPPLFSSEIPLYLAHRVFRL